MSGVVTEVLFGVAMTFTTNKQRRGDQLAIGDVPCGARKAVYRAVWRDPVPADSEIRSAALRLAGNQLETLRRWRTLSLVSFTFLLGLSILNAFINSPWHLVPTPLYEFLLAGQWYWPNRLQKRVELLSIDSGTDS